MTAPRRALLVLLGLLLALAPVFGTVAFLGAAVADDIGEDDDGLTVLSGVHAGFWEEEFPVEVDLWVYTRWVGEGTHEVGVYIADEATREIVAEVEEELDFAGSPVTYLAHDFTGTVFEDAGVYTVTVSLDGEVVGESLYYVGADDELDESPRLVLSVPADDAFTDEDGYCEVTGIFEYFSFERLPATDSFTIATIYFSGEDGDHAHAVRILDPAGKLIAAPAAQRVSFPYGTMTVVTDSFSNLRFPSTGSYAVVVSLDGRDLARYPLVVQQE